MYHEITLIGRLGRDPEMRYTPNGTPVTSFSIATDRRWTGSDGQQRKEVVWWRITAWRRQAETCNEYLSKGDQVFIKGRIGGDRITQSDGAEQIVPHTWTGQDGQTRASYEVTARFVKFLGSPGGRPVADIPGGAPSEPPEEEEEDEIPF
jgi:single-strand DNA-binding protein